jgi:hypothetical protein
MAVRSSRATKTDFESSVEGEDVHTLAEFHAFCGAPSTEEGTKLRVSSTRIDVLLADVLFPNSPDQVLHQISSTAIYNTRIHMNMHSLISTGGALEKMLRRR